MNDLFVKEMRYLKVKDKLEGIPVYGNFCPRCKADSEKVHCHGDDGLLNCHMCDHIFTMQDMKKTITNFWVKRGYS